jgi:hypothetical protein
MPRSGEPCAEPPRDQSSFDEMTNRHLQEAKAIQQLVVRRLVRLHIDELTISLLIRWFESSVRVERQTRAAFLGNDEGERRREFLDRLLADPEACDLAGRLVERLASGGPFAGGAGLVGDAAGVEVGQTPGETRPLAG